MDVVGLTDLVRSKLRAVRTDKLEDEEYMVQRTPLTPQTPATSNTEIVPW